MPVVVPAWRRRSMATASRRSATSMLDNGWMTRERLAGVVRAVNKQAPDLVAITGDFVTGGRLDPFLPILRGELGQLRAPDGIAACWATTTTGATRIACAVPCAMSVSRGLRNAAAIGRGGGEASRSLGWMTTGRGNGSISCGQRRMTRRGGRSCSRTSRILPTSAPRLAASRCNSQGTRTVGRSACRCSVLHCCRLSRCAIRVGATRWVAWCNTPIVGSGCRPPYGRLNSRPEITVITLQSPNSRN